MSETATEPRAWHTTQSGLANATSNNRPTAEIIELRAQFKYERLADRVQEAVDSAPPLTVEQRSKIADILVGGRR